MYPLKVRLHLYDRSDTDTDSLSQRPVYAISYASQDYCLPHINMVESCATSATCLIDRTGVDAP